MFVSALPISSDLAGSITPESVPPYFIDFMHEMRRAVLPCIEMGEVPVKVACCRAYYSVVLFQSGLLLLLAPQHATLHGKLLTMGQPHERVIDVDAGDAHIVCCTESGSVFTFGYRNNFGQLGHGSVWEWAPMDEVMSDDVVADCPIPQLSMPRKLPGFGGGTEEAAHDDDVDDDDDVVEVDVHNVTVPPCAAPPQTRSGIPVVVPRARVLIQSVACGANHTLLLTARMNAVYACGRGHCGQLSGRRLLPAQPTFRLIRLLFGLPVAQVAAAADHSFVLLRTGKLLAFGENHCGQLGLGHTNMSLAPTAVVFCERPHTAAATANTATLRPESRSLASDLMSSEKSPTPPSTNALVPPKCARWMDAKTLQSLRAGYASADSLYYPLRVERIDANPAPGAPRIAMVCCCETMTVAITFEMEWLSCGLPLLRGGGTNNNNNNKKSGGRTDGYGNLGRPLTCRRDAYVFGLMHWSRVLQQAMAEQGLRLGGNEAYWANLSRPQLHQQLECVCYPQAVVVRMTAAAAATENDDDDAAQRRHFFFVQSNVVETLVEVFGGEARDTEVDDDDDDDAHVEGVTPAALQLEEIMECGGGAHVRYADLHNGIANSSGDAKLLLSEVPATSARSVVDDDSIMFVVHSQSPQLLRMRECVLAM